MNEKVICSDCGQPFIGKVGEKQCESDFETIEQQLRNMRNEAIKNSPPGKIDPRTDKEYTVNINRNQNRYRNF